MHLISLNSSEWNRVVYAKRLSCLTRRLQGQALIQMKWKWSQSVLNPSIDTSPHQQMWTNRWRSECMSYEASCPVRKKERASVKCCVSQHHRSEVSFRCWWLSAQSSIQVFPLIASQSHLSSNGLLFENEISIAFFSFLYF